MKFNRILFAVMFIGIAKPAMSQGSYYGYPYEIPADPRSVAMGESFAGLPANPAALMYNPAGLAGLSGLDISYSYRGLNWVPPTEKWGFYSFNAAVATSFGVFAARYDRKSLGSMLVTTSAGPDGDGTEMHLYSHDIALGYALGLGRGSLSAFQPNITITSNLYQDRRRPSSRRCRRLQHFYSTSDSATRCRDCTRKRILRIP